MSDLKRILYVDDEPSIRKVATMVLEKIGGFTVHTCTCGQEALEIVASFEPELILLDVIMPDMEGPATLEKLRALPEASHIPVIFLTGKTRPEDVANLKAMGVLGVIPKPFDPTTLSDQIRSIWEQRE